MKAKESGDSGGRERETKGEKERNNLREIEREVDE